MDSYIIRVNGDIEEIRPEDDRHGFSVKELQAIVGGYFQLIRLGNRGHRTYGFVAIVDDDSKRKGKPRNQRATEYAGNCLFEGDYFAGDVLICRSRLVQ